MPVSIRTVLFAAAILLRWGEAAAQQGPSKPAQSAAKPAQRSTRMGVYTREQWLRGRDVYAGMCASCHPAVTHVGPVFTALWAGKPLADLWGFIRERMPKNEPGSLSEEDYIDVLSYLLRLNGMPVGYEDLPVDSMALSRIRIDSSLAAPPKPAPAR